MCACHVYKSRKDGNLYCFEMQEYIKAPQASSEGCFEMSGRRFGSHGTFFDSRSAQK